MWNMCWNKGRVIDVSTIFNILKPGYHKLFLNHKEEFMIRWDSNDENGDSVSDSSQRLFK